MTERFLRRLELVGFAIAGVCVVAAIVSASTAPQKPPLAPLDPEARAHIGRDFATVEPMLRQRAARDFPGHQWAQGDHFAAMEQDWMRREARRRRTNIGDIALAIDEDLRAHPPDDTTRVGGVAPCQPLPFYD